MGPCIYSEHRQTWTFLHVHVTGAYNIKCRLKINNVYLIAKALASLAQMRRLIGCSLAAYAQKVFYRMSRLILGFYHEKNADPKCFTFIQLSTQIWYTFLPNYYLFHIVFPVLTRLGWACEECFESDISLVVTRQHKGRNNPTVSSIKYVECFPLHTGLTTCRREATATDKWIHMLQILDYEVHSHDVTRKSVLVWTRKRCVRLWRCDGAMTFERWQAIAIFKRDPV